jgi:hypothetical protein
MLELRHFFSDETLMKSYISRSLIALSLLLPTLVDANDLEAALTSETAQFTFRSDSSVIGWGGSELALGFFYNDADDYLGQIGLMQRRQASEKNPLTLGVGVKTYFGQLDIPNQDIVAIAVGGEVRYTFPGVMPMAVYLTVHYAPKITSFSDTEEIIDNNIGFQVEVLPQTVAFVGYRNLKLDLDNGSKYDMDDNRVHVGVRLTF